MDSYVPLNISNVLQRMDTLLYGPTGRIYVRMSCTILEAYKNIVIPIKEIQKIERGRILLLPTVMICLQGQKYRFVIYNRKKFLETVTQFI